MHSETLSIAVAITSLSVVFLSSVMALYRKERALVISAGGFLAYAIGYILLLWQLQGNPWIGLIISNSLIVVFYSTLPWSIRTSLSLSPPWPRRFWFYLLGWLAWQCWFVLITPAFIPRAIGVSVIYIVFGAEFLAASLQNRDPTQSIARRAANIIAIAFIAAYVVRILLLTNNIGAGTSLLDNNWVTAYTMTLNIVFTILWGGILIILDATKLFTKLNDAKNQLESLANSDRLTGLSNRRVFDENIVREVNTFNRFKEPTSLILFDLDHFKQVNDAHGHDAGDRALVHAAGIAKREIRAIDRLYRWGGEEFYVLCSRTSLEGAMTLAEKLRENLETSVLPGIGKITASFGVAELRDGENADLWMQRTDQALYRAKNGGRNRVIAWDRTEQLSHPGGLVEPSTV
jgi:diguanylate cyclase (GGDEF)-like protein